MSDEKEKDWLDEANVLLIGAWDVLGRLGPKLVREVKNLRKELEAARDVIKKIDAIKPLSDDEAGWEGAARDQSEAARKYLYGLVAAPPLLCPRRSESPFKAIVEGDHWQGDDTCSYCGSLNPETLMARIEKGDIELGSTDKSYKVYVKNKGGAKFPIWHTRTCPDVMTCDSKTCTHWTKDERDTTKFYFQHLDLTQQERFVTLYNEKKLPFGPSEGFYVLPFFMKAVK